MIIGFKRQVNYPKVVYKMLHQPTGKSYIGMTEHLSARFYTHMNALKRGAHNSKEFQRDFSDYGGPVYLTILGTVWSEEEERLEREMQLLWGTDKTYNAQDPAFRMRKEKT